MIFFFKSLLEYNTTKKKQVNKLLKPESELDKRKNKEYKVKIIKNSTIYTSEVVKD